MDCCRISSTLLGGQKILKGIVRLALLTLVPSEGGEVPPSFPLGCDTQNRCCIPG
jgi:hypothetical protein